MDFGVCDLLGECKVREGSRMERWKEPSRDWSQGNQAKGRWIVDLAELSYLEVRSWGF